MEHSSGRRCGIGAPPFASLPYVVWVSGPDIPGFEQRYRYVYPLLSPMIRSTWRNATHVVAKCAGEIEMIKSVDNEVQLSFIPNGVDIASFPTRPEIARTAGFTLVCVARLIERKGQHHLIDALSEFTTRALTYF